MTRNRYNRVSVTYMSARAVRPSVRYRPSVLPRACARERGAI